MSIFEESQHPRATDGAFASHVGAEQEGSVADGVGMDVETGRLYMAAAQALYDTGEDPSLKVQDAVCGTFGKDVARTSSDVIYEMAADGRLDCFTDSDVASVIARRLDNVLARDPDASFRSHVSHERATDPALLYELAEDPDVDVRAGVAWNRNTDQQTLSELADNDPHFVVRSHARKQLELRNPQGWE